MGKFVLKRLLALIPTILIIVFVVYFILDLTPSDPGHLILGQMASEEAVAAKNAELGYDKPFTVRYAKATRSIFGIFATAASAIAGSAARACSRPLWPASR